ncbi:hypothetical protein [Thiohalomonas denitrificans]|uniref:Uncharacterized protein n=1 Tax=Thiohalomonas denitrificans TaxID=415747 RepID=A0A1G5Q1P5_9GAMM|nr:hypothetical protein [Thiohalomonas denitrificans]SCZ55572.1 hypothetical protein SAMN03097708_01154 [Thiohalomonas denitrificans]
MNPFGGAINGFAVAYLAFWLIVAWFSAYAKHTRETARILDYKLSPELPKGVSLHLRAPWYARLGIVENILTVSVLGYGLAVLDWRWVLGGFGFFLLILLPAATQLLTPHPGSWHYVKILRQGLRNQMAESEQKGDQERAQVYRIALQRIDQGL